MASLPRLGLYSGKTKRGRRAAELRVLRAAQALRVVVREGALAVSDMQQDGAEAWLEFSNALAQYDDFDRAR